MAKSSLRNQVVKEGHPNYGLPKTKEEGPMKEEINPVDLERVKEDNLLRKIQTAQSQGQLTMSYHEVPKVIIMGSGKFLIGEKKLLFPQAGQRVGNKRKNHSDFLIDFLLSNGGEVEFVSDGLLKNYGHIVVVLSDKSTGLTHFNT